MEEHKETKGILHDEHLLLGGQMAEAAGGLLAPQRYEGVDEAAAFAEGVALVDLSGMGSCLVTGPAASALCNAVFAGRTLDLGEVACELALLGDGAIASLALLARTGRDELACWDLAGRGDTLISWMGFVAAIEQQGVRPFDGCELDDAAEALVPLLLWGPQATNVLADYLGEQLPPGPGTIANRKLDRIACLVATPQLGEQPCHLVLVPPAYARVLWRSFLSFQTVSPVGLEALVEQVKTVYPFLQGSGEAADRIACPRKQLESLGLLREDGSFIGARGLA